MPEVVRRGYEWTRCIDGLGILKSDARTRRVGAGHEPMIFWLADRWRGAHRSRVGGAGDRPCGGVGLLSADGASFIQEIEFRPGPAFNRIKLAASRTTQAIGLLAVRSSAHGGGIGELSFVHV